VTQIFINYRKDDEPFGAAMLDQQLSAKFGSGTVFFASKSIPLGTEWEPEMFDAVRRSVALLAVIGRHWLTATDQHGRPRLDDPGDFVRREIVTALELDKQVIPVLLDTPRPERQRLPGPLQPLCARQGVAVRFRDAQPDIDKLAAKLRRLVPELRDLRPEPAEPKFAAEVNGGVMNQTDTIENKNKFKAKKMNFKGDFYAGPRLG
jgi:TIR domain-containing protein